jgi:exodeoxyribonuclease VIII
MTTTPLPTSGKIIPKIGAHRGVSFEEYCRWNAVNWHSLEPFRRSALEAHHAAARPDDAGPALVKGGAFHSAVLEPEKFEKIYAVMPKFDGHPNSKVYRDAREAWRAAHRCSVEISADEHDELLAMSAAVRAHSVTSAILKAPGRNELSIAWRDKETAELCKGRIDRLCRLPASVLDPNAAGEVLALVDFKSTSRFHRFDLECAEYGYHAQLAFYSDGLYALEPAPITCLIVAVQSVPPFDVAVFTSADAVDHGRRLYRRLLAEAIRCRTERNWPGICPVGTIPIILPAWAREPENQKC